MKEKYIKSNLPIIIFISILIVAILSFISYRFFMNNFEELEKEQNKKNIHSVLDLMNNELSNIEGIINDYAKWDDTYNFIKTNNQHYLYENFREGSNTLEDLELDFIIFTNLRNKKLFSKYIEKDFYQNNKFFENSILKKFENINELATIYRDNGKIVKVSSNYFYIVKKYISNSDDTVSSNGFIYSGKLISNDVLNNMTKVFDKVDIKNKTFSKNDLVINSEYLKNATVKVEKDDTCVCLKNTIQLYDYKNNYILSLITQSKRDLIEKGKVTIFYYNIVISVFLLLVLFLIFKNQRILERYNIKLKSEVTEKTKKLVETNEKLRILSERDELTKINNRRNFFKLGEEALLNSNKNNIDLTVIMMDLDNFKKINDTYGHAIGDKVLIEFTNIVNKQLEGKHIFGRLGGEEFAVIFENISENEAYELSDKIRAEIQKATIKENDLEINFTTSVGLSRKNNFQTLDEILKEADFLLYEAKNRGRNRIVRHRS